MNIKIAVLLNGNCEFFNHWVYIIQMIQSFDQTGRPIVIEIIVTEEKPYYISFNSDDISVFPAISCITKSSKVLHVRLSTSWYFFHLYIWQHSCSIIAWWRKNAKRKFNYLIFYGISNVISSENRTTTWYVTLWYRFVS